MPWLLMPWLPAMLHKKALSFIRKDFSYLYYLSMEDWYEIKIYFYTPRTTKLIIYWFHSVRQSVRPSVCPACSVRSVACRVLDRFFPYLIQMITSMRRCDDLWPWPISSRSFDLDFENRVRSVTFSVLDRLFPYLPQIITTIKGCVAC